MLAELNFHTVCYLNRLAGSSSKDARRTASKTKSQYKTHANFLDVPTRQRDMDRYGISHQVATLQHSLDPNIFDVPEDERLELCRFVNNEMAKVMDASRGRIRPLGTVPLDSFSRGGRDEMRRAVKDLGMGGFMVMTNVRGKPIDSYRAFWEEAAKSGAAVYIHPDNPVRTNGRPYEDQYDLTHVLGWPFETGLALSRLIFSGIMDRHPNLKILTHHLGGVIPFFMGRIDESYSSTWTTDKEEQKKRTSHSKPLVECFKMFYHDTAVGGSTAALRCGYEVFGVDRLVFSTDYPWGPDNGRGRLARYPDVVRKMGVSKEDQEKIFETNIRKLITFD